MLVRKSILDLFCNLYHVYPCLFIFSKNMLIGVPYLSQPFHPILLRKSGLVRKTFLFRIRIRGQTNYAQFKIQNQQVEHQRFIPVLLIRIPIKLKAKMWVRIYIRIKVTSRIQIRIKMMWIRITGSYSAKVGGTRTLQCSYQLTKPLLLIVPSVTKKYSTS